MDALTFETLDQLSDSIKDILFAIDQKGLDSHSSAHIFEKLNKVIITSTLLVRLTKASGQELKAEEDILQIKLQILSVLRLLTKSVRQEHFSTTHDLIRLELRDSLLRWIIHIIPGMRREITESLSGSTTPSEVALTI